ncbi:hypothetical protein GJ496_006610 [Pomphorhynchus laevis]|nr:hypothetical protein GJ496_006610 [Pomphorhynchus laevis]
MESILGERKPQFYDRSVGSTLVAFDCLQKTAKFHYFLNQQHKAIWQENHDKTLNFLHIKIQRTSNKTETALNHNPIHLKSYKFLLN